MADIIQAAKWMGEGYTVTRPSLLPRWYDHDSRNNLFSVHPDKHFEERLVITTTDILANDWEVHGD